MPKKELPKVTVQIDKIVGGGQALATMEDGRKLFVWGGLPSEKVEVQLTKKKSHLAEGVVTQVFEASPERLKPRDPESFLSTSPWQIMSESSEQHYKAALIEEAFEMHDIVLPDPITMADPGAFYDYRNKMEFSFWWDKETGQVELSFYKRGSHGKIPVQGSSLARPSINEAALRLRDILQTRKVPAFSLKTVIVRASQSDDIVMQLYAMRDDFAPLSDAELKQLNVQGFELIYSNPQSPASVITKRLQTSGDVTLTDSVLGIKFNYAAESFFQINLPVYEQALGDMKTWLDQNKPTVDLYSGVGSIGLTIGGENVTLVEINESAVREMKRNIHELGRENNAEPVLAASESALDYINQDSQIIVDPPRAGLHNGVIDKLINAGPDRIVYLSCNPVTQARDVALLAEKYGVRYHKGYNFFPRTPHIEHLVVLDRVSQ